MLAGGRSRWLDSCDVYQLTGECWDQLQLDWSIQGLGGCENRKPRQSNAAEQSTATRRPQESEQETAPNLWPVNSRAHRLPRQKLRRKTSTSPTTPFFALILFTDAIHLNHGGGTEKAAGAAHGRYVRCAALQVRSAYLSQSARRTELTSLFPPNS